MMIRLVLCIVAFVVSTDPEHAIDEFERPEDKCIDKYMERILNVIGTGHVGLDTNRRTELMEAISKFGRYVLRNGSAHEIQIVCSELRLAGKNLVSGNTELITGLMELANAIETRTSLDMLSIPGILSEGYHQVSNLMSKIWGREIIFRLFRYLDEMTLTRIAGYLRSMLDDWDRIQSENPDVLIEYPALEFFQSLEGRMTDIEYMITDFMPHSRLSEVEVAYQRMMARFPQYGDQKKSALKYFNWKIQRSVPHANSHLAYLCLQKFVRIAQRLGEYNQLLHREFYRVSKYWSYTNQGFSLYSLPFPGEANRFLSLDEAIFGEPKPEKVNQVDVKVPSLIDSIFDTLSFTHVEEAPIITRIRLLLLSVAQQSEAVNDIAYTIVNGSLLAIDKFKNVETKLWSLYRWLLDMKDGVSSRLSFVPVHALRMKLDFEVNILNNYSQTEIDQFKFKALKAFIENHFRPGMGCDNYHKFSKFLSLIYTHDFDLLKDVLQIFWEEKIDWLNQEHSPGVFVLESLIEDSLRSRGDLLDISNYVRMYSSKMSRVYREYSFMLQITLPERLDEFALSFVPQSSLSQDLSLSDEFEKTFIIPSRERDTLTCSYGVLPLFIMNAHYVLMSKNENEDGIQLMFGKVRRAIITKVDFSKDIPKLSTFLRLMYDGSVPAGVRLDRIAAEFMSDRL